MQVLPEADKKQILMQNVNLHEKATNPDICIVMLYSELRKQQTLCASPVDHDTTALLHPPSACQSSIQCAQLHQPSTSAGNPILVQILQRCSSWFKAKNILARIYGILNKHLNMLELQAKAESKYILCFQQDCSDYIKRGNGKYSNFLTANRHGIL